jgi:hypothetical protein
MKRSILFLLIFAGACGTLQQPEQIEPTNFSVKLTRTECFGTCPVYTVEVSPDGKVSFIGLKNTKVIGSAEGTLNRETLDLLAAEINKANIFALKDAYTRDSGNCPSYATDNPTVTLEVRSGRKFKKIEHYLGCSDKSGERNEAYPENLTRLEKRIDQTIGTDRWTGK